MDSHGMQFRLYFVLDKNLNPKTIHMSVICNWLNEKKQPLEHVQELARHKWSGTTEKYIKVNSQQQRELINRYFPVLKLTIFGIYNQLKFKIMALKPGPKRIADSTGKPDQRQRDNKSTPGNTPSLKPSKSSEKK